MSQTEHTPLTEQEQERHLKNILLSPVGVAGVEKLKASSVLIIGLGGLGSAVAFYLAAAGVGRLGLLDSDTVTLSNLQRQILHTTSRLGMEKTESARRQLADLNPDIKIELYCEYLTVTRGMELFPHFDVVVGCTDSFASYYLINEACMKSGKPYVFAACSQFEGQVSVFIPGKTPCYECIFPKPAEPKEMPEPTRGIFSTVPGTIGTIQANECLKLLLNIGEVLTSKLLVYDALSMNFENICIQRNAHCRVCAGL